MMRQRGESVEFAINQVFRVIDTTDTSVMTALLDKILFGRFFFSRLCKLEPSKDKSML